jgi:membrane protease YdiL (CAAX protease family)
LACFAVLARYSTWLPFAFAGIALATVALVTGAMPVAWLRPSFARSAAGLLVGASMVILTHVLHALLVAAVPGVLPATRELFVLLNVVGFSPAQRAVLIVLIASCEELLFRAPLLESATAGAEHRPRRLTPRELRRIFGFAVAYAITTAPLGNSLLIVCAFVCGSVWGALGVEARSLTVPILAHVVWDLGVLLVWPLPTRL